MSVVGVGEKEVLSGLVAKYGSIKTSLYFSSESSPMIKLPLGALLVLALSACGSGGGGAVGAAGGGAATTLPALATVRLNQSFAIANTLTDVSYVESSKTSSASIFITKIDGRDLVLTGSFNLPAGALDGYWARIAGVTGTLTDFSQLYRGSPVVSVSGINVSMAEFYSRLLSADYEAIWRMVTQGAQDVQGIGTGTSRLVCRDNEITFGGALLTSVPQTLKSFLTSEICNQQITNISPAGIWYGTDNNNREVLTLISKTGQFNTFFYEDSRQYAGTVSSSGNNLSGVLSGFGYLGANLFFRTENNGGGSFAGVISPNESVRGRFDVPPLLSSGLFRV